MELNEAKHMLECPYCGSTILLEESDAVKIEKIRNERLHQDYEASLKYSTKPKEKKGGLIWLILAIFFGLYTFAFFGEDPISTIILSGVIALWSGGLWIATKKDILPDQQILRTLLKAAPFFLILAMTNDYSNHQEVAAAEADCAIVEAAFEESEAVAWTESTEAAEPESEEEYVLTKKDKERLALGESTYVWPSGPAADLLPVADYEYGHLEENTTRRVTLEVYHITQRDFTNYIKLCKEAGFTFYETMKKNVFKADLADHTHLEIAYTEDPHTFHSFKIKLETPIPMSDIEWPDHVLLDQLPAPPSLVGNLWALEEEKALIYLEGVDQEHFRAYIDTCIDMGFETEHVFDYIASLTFPGNDKKRLALTLKNWDVMQILIYDKES